MSFLPSPRHSQHLHGSSMTSLRTYPVTPPTPLLIPLWTLSTQPPRVPLITSIYGLCQVNPHHLLALLPLLLHQGETTLSPRSLFMTPCIPGVSNATRKYLKISTYQTHPRMCYITTHSSIHRTPPCLLTKTPFTRRNQIFYPGRAYRLVQQSHSRP
jgi:hypothetical protein